MIKRHDIRYQHHPVRGGMCSQGVASFWAILKLLINGMKKIIAIILTVTLVVTSMPADVFALRPIAYRSSVEETDDSEDSLTREEKIARARALMQSLRPEFHGKKKLTTREFENHVRRMAEEQGVTYIRITEGPINTILFRSRSFCQAKVHI